ncbi:unnamed protein product [Citrullus colocynthis]|uniref:F-box domain-containing protein n=1 Tax=Citrullus colocynthis TaxID=252529 RepID=A0ABP0YVW1_9ROSI
MIWLMSKAYLYGLTMLPLVLPLRRKRKRNDIENMDGIRKKQSQGVKKVEQEVELVDAISELPESVIHHILSFLRSAKEAARTRILSKKWIDIWKSYSVLTFDERFFLKTEAHLSSDKRRQMFIDSIDNSLRSHLTQNLGIYKLVLRITPKLVPYLRWWVDMAGENGLVELDIHVEITRQRYIVPPFMHSIKTLTGLRLHGLNCSSFKASEFNNLQNLYLRRLQLDQQIIQKLVSTSPLLMDLRIKRISRTKKLADFGVLYILEEVDITGPIMTDTFHNRLLFSFPILEKLDLSRCKKFKNIEISNAKLRSLRLRSCNRLKVVDIDTLTPCSLDYKGHHMVSVLGRLHLNEAEFPLDVIIHDESKEIFLPPCPNLKLHVIKPSTDAKDLLDDLLAKGHPERIIVASSSSSEVWKAFHGIEREADPSYINSNRKCWRHFLEDAKIMNIAGVEDISSWFNCQDQRTIMQLHWEPSMHFGEVSHHKKVMKG